jgi:hypothetical protein
MRYGLVHGREIEIGPAALMVIYGGVTAQVTWLDGDQVVTASATRLYGDRAWAIEAARSTARLLDRQRRWQSASAH